MSRYFSSLGMKTKEEENKKRKEKEMTEVGTPRDCEQVPGVSHRESAASFPLAERRGKGRIGPSDSKDVLLRHGMITAGEAKEQRRQKQRNSNL